MVHMWFIKLTICKRKKWGTNPRFWGPVRLNNKSNNQQVLVTCPLFIPGMCEL